MQKNLKRLKEENQKEFTKSRRLTVYSEMSKSYREGLLPQCPNCKELFDPINVTVHRQRPLTEI